MSSFQGVCGEKVFGWYVCNGLKYLLRKRLDVAGVTYKQENGPRQKQS